MLWRIVLSYAVFGVIVVNNIIIESAPISEWMIGKSLISIQSWIKKRGGTMSRI